MKKTAVVICPGRGTYNKAELGYLHTYHQDKKDFINLMDSYRASKNKTLIWDLDGREKFKASEFLKGENAASLIHASSYLDYKDINEEIEVVAITGNSMGWYLALALANVLNEEDAVHLIDTMGSQMTGGLIGGQIIYPEMDESWIIDHAKSKFVDQKIKEVGAYTSIYFGGYRVIGGSDEALRTLMNELPKIDDLYPMKLNGNAAFHTPLLKETAEKAREELPIFMFNTPKVPLINGLGKIYTPHSTDLFDLWDYTLGAQIYDTYNFSKAVEISVKEFNPDYLILTGPGTNLGGAVAQTLINTGLKNIHNKEEFKDLQKKNPYVVAMGNPDQRKLVI